jgi:GNAT superfamily N-acetyltransferase
MDEVVVRRARIPADLEAIHALYAEQARLHADQWPEHFRAPDSTRVVPELTRLAREETSCLLLATMDARVVGLVCCHLLEQRDPGMLRYDGPVAYVADIVVSHDVRRRGIGTMLMEHAEEWARERGARTMSLQVYDGNEVAKAFYQRHGFQPVTLQMRKRLVTGPDQG